MSACLLAYKASRTKPQLLPPSRKPTRSAKLLLGKPESDERRCRSDMQFAERGLQRTANTQRPETHTHTSTRTHARAPTCASKSTARQHAVNKPQCVTDYARSAANVFSYQRLLLCASAAGTRWIQACGDARKYTSALRSTAEANKHLNALMSMFMHSRERVCVHTDVCMCAHRRFTLFRGGLHMQCLHLQTRVLKHCRTFSRGFLHNIA